MAAATFAACSGGGGATVGEAGTGGAFRARKTEPVNGAVIYLNDPVSIDFTNRVDLDSANLSTMTFQAIDQSGNPVSELVTGNFSIGTTPGDATPGRRLLFVPRFASNNDYSDGGFKAGRTYVVQLVGGQANNSTVLRDVGGRALEQPLTFQFATREGTQPAQLFRNPKAGGPTRTGLSVSTATDLQSVPLGLFGAPPLEVRLDFDQALNPNDSNIPVSFDGDPLVRDEALRGRVYLEYKDPEYDLPSDPNDYTWIPTEVELERNDLTGATLALRPIGVLPNNAEIRVIVEPTVEDISGESNVANPSYNRVFGTFRTTSGYQQQWNGIVEEFADAANIDLGASFPEAQAQIGPGFIRAGFAFEGSSTSLEYEPTANEVVLNTAFTQIVPKSGLPFTVAGGVFNFRNVTIPQGVTVRGTGPNPMVWLCSGRFTVSGTLSVSGGDGARVDTLQSANVAKAGGIGACGGGNGGEGTPSATLRDLRGGTGRGPLQEAGKGGRGGYLACVAGCYTGTGYNSSGGGSGGGGGTMATQGDPNWRGAIPATPIIPNTAPTQNTTFQQLRGFGGSGCSGGAGTRSGFLLGGEPGDPVFTDTRQDNNFWGSAIDINRNLRITGELSMPVGGGGGGGGGDTSPGFNCTLTGNDPRNDYSGGGGGGGGGVLIVKALQEITITASGRIIADGGNGGGGEQVGACGEAGGGGAGAGGMVILMSAKAIIIEPHGNPATNRYVYGAPTNAATPSHPFLRDDYDFAISADGGVCTTGGFGAINIQKKYPANGASMVAGTSYDTEPLGGLGGMGIVQLMVPPGENLEDGTNTRLDDNVIFRLQGASTNLAGDAKRQLLAWRGFPNATGVFVDDSGMPTNIGNNEGDIRPSPTLLPVPFNARSRVRSRWIDTGASQRRELTAADGLPRGIVTAGGESAGPTFEFAGLRLTGDLPGYVDYEQIGQAVRIRYPVVLSATPLGEVDASATFLGQPAYRITLPNPVLGEANRYVQYQAELLTATGAVLAGYRILAHDDRSMVVDPGESLLPNDAAQVQIRAKFFQITTNGSEGLGTTYSAVGGPPIPVANVRIGFAFHQDPDPANILNGRYPDTSEQDFLRDLQDPQFLEWIAMNGPPRYVQWDVVFDMAYKPTVTEPPALSPSTPRPALQFLRLPFRF